MINSYLTILEESLEKKIGVLDKIREINRIQLEMTQKEPFDAEGYDKCVDEKDVCIKELEKLDEGFETLYGKLKEELHNNREKFAVQIKRLQELIGEITDRSVAIRVQESHNKTAVEAYFKNERQSLRQASKYSKAAYGYYQNNKAPEVSHFMDTQK